MRSLHKYMPITLLSLSIGALLVQMALMVQLAHAHLMVAQHGTLNILEDGVFMVLSLPISAFDGVDDDNDGQVSMIEFNHHRSAIIDAVVEHVTLNGNQGKLSLQGTMLSPVVPHDMAGEPLSQLTVMGRFALTAPASTLSFHMGLYGRQAHEQSLEITATRARDKHRAVFELTPAAPARVIFSDSAQPW